jgi:hypothetical protein
MEIRSNQQGGTKADSKGKIITGRIISGLVILFLLFDAIMKIIRESHSVEGSVKLGWPDHSVTALGILLLVCTIFYSIPRTAVLGAILITGYLGGAIAIMFRVGGLYLRDGKISQLLPIQRD